MLRPQSLCLLLLTICASFAGTGLFIKPALAEQPPNVVLIFADDLGYGDLGCYGATKLQTPNIDQLAAQGRKFTDAHSASAVCTPSRYGLLTGEYPMRAMGGKGIWGPLPNSSQLIIDTQTLTIGKVFKNKGYATACLGKWHLGFKKGKNNWQVPLRPGPQDVGFDHYFGVPLVNSGSPFVYVEDDTIVGHDPNDPLVPGGKPASPTPRFPPEASVKSPNKFGGALKAHQIYDDEKTGTLLTQRAVKWIAEKRDEPFFLYLPTPNIHHPFTPAPQFKGTSECGLYGDFVHELDWMVGEVLKSLEENGLSDNTLVIFTSDNGAMLNRAGRDAVKAGHKINGDLLGFKFGVWEGGHRVPLIAKWPGKITPGTQSNQLISQIDMLATFTALTDQDAKILEGKDSINMLPAFLEDPAEPLRTELFLAPRQQKNLAVRKGKWMYIGARGSGGFRGSKPEHHAWGGAPAVQFAGRTNSDIENGRIKKDAPQAQLYDLASDRNQTRNLHDQYPDVVKELSARLAPYKGKTDKPKARKKQKSPAKPKRNPTPTKPVEATYTKPAEATYVSTSAPATRDVVSIESLLSEMIDHDSVARFPENNFRLRQTSSYNVASKTPDDPKGWFKNTKAGDVVTIRIPTTSLVAQNLALHTTKSRDFGILKFSVNGNPAGEAADQFSAAPVPSGPISLGSFTPVDGACLLEVEVTGKNPKSKDTLFGVDCVTLNETK